MSPTFLKLLWGASLLGPSLAFLRPKAAASPDRSNYTTRGPDYDVTESILEGISGHMGASPTTVNTWTSLLDINTGEYFGINNLATGTISNQTFKVTGGNVTMDGTTPDLISEMHVDSTITGASFNLTMQPRGPNLFHGASGTFFFGTGLTNEWAIPTMSVTGTITVSNGTKIKVIPEKSLSWFDRQWGLGIATQGYFWFDIILENGVILALWNTNPEPGSNRTATFATVLFPDGHHEVHIADKEIHKGKPFVSAATNLTFYTTFQLHIPTLDSLFDVKVLHNVGEMPLPVNPTPASTLFEGYAEFNGTFGGKNMTGFGLSEQLHAIILPS